jgi:hypothetical protein
MARAFGMLGAATTGFSSIGILRSYEETEPAEARYALDANGEPADANFVKGPKTISATVEIEGTIPDAAADVTIGAATYKVTKATRKWEGDGSVATADIEASISL